jgi:hypothetical protein
VQVKQESVDSTVNFTTSLSQLRRYLSDPYLINGKKFDLRIYVLVTGVDPLRIYIHKEVTILLIMSQDLDRA